MLVLIGASASGKTEIAKILISNYGFNKIITNTTREIRKNETDGIDYHFLSEEEFLLRKKQGYFLETELYDGNYYGTAFKDAALNAVLIVDTNGANSIYEKQIKNSVFVYLETKESIRMSRMTERGDLKQDIENRIKKDKKHFSSSKINHIDYIIDTSEKTLEELAKEIVTLYNNKVLEV